MKKEITQYYANCYHKVFLPARLSLLESNILLKHSRLFRYISIYKVHRCNTSYFITATCFFSFLFFFLFFSFCNFHDILRSLEKSNWHPVLFPFLFMVTFSLFICFYRDLNITTWWVQLWTSHIRNSYNIFKLFCTILWSLECFIIKIKRGLVNDIPVQY